MRPAIAWPALLLIIAILVAPRLAVGLLVNTGSLRALQLNGETEYAGLEYRNAEVSFKLPELMQRWLDGHLALTREQYGLAAKELSALEFLAASEPLVFADLLIAYSHSGQASKAVALYEAYPYRLRRLHLAYEAVAVAYLDADRNRPPAASTLARIEALRPNDLFASYYLREQAKNDRNATAVETYSQRLKQFSAGVVDPAEEKWVTYGAEVAPLLLADGTWDRETLAAVSKLWAWKHPQARGLREMLEQLAAEHPAEAVWPFILGEVLQRSGNLVAAKVAYREAWTREPNPSRTWLRLGMVAELEADEDEAYSNYERYYQLAPGDFVGLMRLVGAAETTQTSKIDALRQEKAVLGDDSVWVASQLGWPAGQVMLGPNLVQNGDLQEWRGSVPTGFSSSYYHGLNDQGGRYTVGKDDLEQPSARILNLWFQPSNSSVSPYGELRGNMLSIESGKYLVSVDYLFEPAVSESALFLVADYTRADGSILVATDLPPTDSQWRRLRVLADATEAHTLAGPLIRLAGGGDLHFSNVEIREVRETGGAAP